MNNITLCPQREEYQAFINDPESKQLDKEDYKKQLKYLTEQYKLHFHNYVAEVYPYLRFEIGEERVYWNYDEDEGVYNEVAQSTVREMVIKLLVDEGLMIHATEAMAKTVLARYRACYAERGSTYDDFDSDDDTWFHAKNGWLNLTNRDFKPHTPDMPSLFTSQVDYDPDATCPLYDAFLDVESQMPADQVRVIDQFSGYMLTPSIKEQQMLIFEGRPGSGKSMLPEAWGALLGKKAVTSSLTKIGDSSNRFFGGKFVNKTFLFVDEANPKTRDINESFQNLITAKTMDFERKGIQGEVTFKNRLKLVLALNEMPDHMPPGMERRYKHIYFPRCFNDEGIVDTSISIRIMRDELSGILNRMLDGLDDYRKMGSFTTIDNEAERKREYSLAADDFSAFLAEHFDPSNDDEIRYDYQEMRAAFVAEFPTAYNKSLSVQAFNKKLTSNRLPEFAKIKKGRTNKLRGYLGLKLKDGHKFPQYQGDRIVTPQHTDW